MLTRFVASWLSNVLALFAASAIVPGVGYGDDFWVLLLAGLVFAAVNLVVRPLVILFTLPAVILSLGIALLFVNMLMLYLTDVIVGDFETGSFWSTLGATVVVWLVNMLLQALLEPERHRLRRRLYPNR